MIPLQLKLRNFLSYGSHTQTINFEPHHLICLSGKNGHGKSALIDAITWAIWGQARKIQATAKADEGLLRLGESQMTASIDFMCNGKKYRICREFIKQQKKSHTELDFGVANQESSGFTSLNEKTLRGTQEKIITTIGLSYESCINSIFLRQGQSNEFSNKSAKERKQVLATILGLNRFEETRKQALEKIREATQAKEHIRQFIDKVTQETNQKTELKKKFLELKKKIDEQTEYEKKLQKKWALNSHNHQKLTKQKNELSLLEFKQQQQHITLEKKITKLRSIVAEWRSVRKKKRQQEQSKSNKFSLQELEKQEQILAKKYTDQLQLKEQLLAVQEQHNKIVHQLQNSYSAHEQKLSVTSQTETLTIAALNKQIEQLVATQTEHNHELITRKSAIKKIEQTIITFEKIDEKIKEQEKSFDRRKTFYHQFVARGNQRKVELKNLEQKQRLGTTTQAPSCPLCEQALSGARKRFLQTKFTHQQHFYEHQLNRLKKIIPDLKKMLVQQHTDLTKLKQQLAEHGRLTDQKNDIEQRIKSTESALQLLTKQIKQAQQEKSDVEKTLLLTQKKLEHHTKYRENYFAQNEKFASSKKEISELSAKLTACAYNTEEHEKIKQQLHLIRQQDDNSSVLLKQLSLQEQRKEIVHELCSELKVVKKELVEIENNIKKYAALEEQHTELKNERKELDGALTKINQNTSENLQSKGALEQQLKVLDQREKELKQLQDDIKQHENNVEDYQEIAQALSKNGIQALLIENALPEIEHEANNLLSKLTNNQSHIIIESLRDLKSGGTRETLDIKISDAMGIRPYELFSGGEAFRIDFALRIAISKLLARRSGTSLQTLIIDEGFGSQDEDGLANIMEALYLIQDEFAKIIIVSHLPTMKDQFPTHFLVNKSATGSTIRVLEQG